MKPPLLHKPNGNKLEINVQALTCMLAYIQNFPRQREAGGVLLGRHILNSEDIVIDEVTVPMAGDRRGQHYFHRSRHRHQRAIDRAWRESGGTCTYLGEWHTHPEVHPMPSTADLREWQRKLRNDVFAGEVLYFIIVGIEIFRVWEGYQKNGECRLIGEYLHKGVHYVQDDDSA